MGICVGKKTLIILGIIFSIILMSVLWSINKVGGYIGSLNVPRAFLCKEIQKNIDPVPLTEKLYSDEKLVCVWFEYERSKPGDKIKIKCYRNGTLIADEHVALTSEQGVRAFCLVKSNGTSLPIGKYQVVLSSATKVWHKFTFEVIQKPKIKATKKKAGGANIAKNKKSHRREHDRSGRGKRR